MTALDLVISSPRLIEVDHVDLAASPAELWERVRHGDLAVSPLVRALFALRTLPERLAGDAPDETVMCVDQMVSTPERPGFQVLVDDPPREVVVGAIGKVWMPEIPFVHIADGSAFQGFDAPEFVRVAWAMRVLPLGDCDARMELEVRVDATDEASWERFVRYFRVIGPGSRFIRRSLMAALAREFGTPEGFEKVRSLPGDALLPDAVEEITQGITIAATPEAIWPWLVQMGCDRAGFYSVDALDNGGVRSAREVHPEFQGVRVGDVIVATTDGENGFEVLALDAPRALALGALFDQNEEQRLPFASQRPARYWHITWAFVLEPLDAGSTRLHVRARAAFSASEKMHAAWIRPVHHLMEAAQLRHLAARAEGRLARDDWRDVLEGAQGVAVVALTLLTPFLRGARNRWGLTESEAERVRPGDERVPEPRWSWTHGIEIDAPASAVWPWIAQIGADRGGFYSYQSLENLAGCGLRNAEAVHPEWAHREGDGLMLHPKMPPLRVAALVPGEYLLACVDPDERLRAEGRPWAALSWLFQVEPLGDTRCRLVSRFRSACSDDLASRLALGPTFLEPIGFAMDRRMLLGVKGRAEVTAANRHDLPADSIAARNSMNTPPVNLGAEAPAQPWSDEELSTWERVKEALHRDWTQTRFDLGAHSGTNLHQGATDTVMQALGVEAIPEVQNALEPSGFEAVRFGYLAARHALPNESHAWDEDTDMRLRGQWEAHHEPGPWSDARSHARYGWEYGQSLKPSEARSPQSPPRRERLVDVLKGIPVAMLVTGDRTHRVQARPVTVADVRDDGDLVLVTSAHSAMVQEVERNPDVTVVFQGTSKCVTVRGRASVSLDHAEIERLWRDEWKVFFPGGRSDSELCLVRIETMGGDYWDLSGAAGVHLPLNAVRVFVAP